MHHADGRFSIFIIGFLAFAISGCGNKLTKPSGPSGTLSKDLASKFVSGSGAGTMTTLANNTDATTVTSTFASPSGTTPTSRGVRSLFAKVINDTRFDSRADSCTPTKSGNSADADGDSIPAAETDVFACNISSSGLNFSISGGYTITDKDDTKKFPLAGFSMALSDFTVSLNATASASAGTSTSSASVKIDTTGTYDLTTAGNVLTSAAGIRLAIDGAKSGKLEYWSDVTTTVDDLSAPKTAGKVTVNGYYVANYDTQNFTLQFSGTDVTYASSCTSTHFKDGVFTIKDGSSNKITMTYANCVLTSAFNGTAL